MDMRKIFWPLFVGFLLIGACTQDRMPELIELEVDLEEAVESSARRNGVESYILPDGQDLSAIPQDLVNNPLNASKVELGKFLFYETGFATEARRPEGLGTYSCATCHIPEAGFKPGFRQGIADGGIGFGVNGEARRRSPAYETPELDVQSARPLSLVNVAYVKNTLWNGRFGAEGDNVGTDHLWKESDGTAMNALGFEAIETQNFEGLETHRIHITKNLIDDFGYTDLFDAAFPEMEDDLKYSNHAGSLAISAYIRTLISDSCLLYTSPSPRDATLSRMPSSA